jgi:hypothetical protein
MTVQHHHPPDVVHRVLAERLRGCEPSDGLRAMVGSQGTDWERIIGHASDRFVLPAFAAALQELGLTGPLDEELGAFLAAVHAANEERNKELSDELLAAVAVLNQADIEPVVLKGAIRLIDGLYPDHGWRMMRDLDLLVPKARWAGAIGLFQRAGYVLRGEVNKEVPLRRPGAVVDIDLHRELFSTRRRERLLRADEVLNASCRAAFQDAVVRLPSMAHQIVHLIGHRQLQDHNYAYGRIAWRDWFEAAALEHWAQEKIDWQAVLARFVAAGYRDPLLTFLLSLKGRDLCALPVPGRIGPLTSLHQRRLRLQAQSTTFAYVSSWAVWCVCELRRQVQEHDDTGRPRVIRNAKRLIFGRGAASEMARSLVGRAPRPE